MTSIEEHDEPKDAAGRAVPPVTPPQPAADEPPAAEKDEEGPVGPTFLKAIREALENGDQVAVRALVEPLHAADTADLIAFLEPDERPALIAALGSELDPQVLSELDESLMLEIVELLKPEELAAAVSQLDSDDAVYILEDLDSERRQQVLDVIPDEDRIPLEEGLAYPEDSAGRLMRRELVAVPQFWNVGQTLDFLRETEDLPDEFHEIFIVDPRYHPVGTVPLNRVLRAKRDVLMETLMEEDQRVIAADTDQEEVAYLFRQYNLLSAAVTDRQGRLVGVITVDDVVDVIQEEAEEDILRLGGVTQDDSHDTLFGILRRRLPWLMVNLGTAVVAATVISLFDASIEKLVALAVLMPIVASMGGNAGTQTMTVTVRALATREFNPANTRRTFRREVSVNFWNGVVLAVFVGALAGFWFENPVLGIVLGSALVFNMLVAGFFGVFIPLVLH
ncbi:MAG TPA: magnesium transporter, partial [Sphingomonadales bacterium]